MGRILAIDFGKRRVGFGVTDPLRIIATPLKTVPFNDAIAFLKNYCLEETVDTIVVGQPRRMSGDLSDIEKEILVFIEKINKALPEMEIVRFDERFTSKMAAQSLIDSGVKKMKRRDKSLLDSTSASIILQDYLISIQ